VSHHSKLEVLSDDQSWINTSHLLLKSFTSRSNINSKGMVKRAHKETKESEEGRKRKRNKE
jgi:hypothetical protein